jgi:hypothetical protein
LFEGVNLILPNGVEKVISKEMKWRRIKMEPKEHDLRRLHLNMKKGSFQIIK